MSSLRVNTQQQYTDYISGHYYRVFVAEGPRGNLDTMITKEMIIWITVQTFTQGLHLYLKLNKEHLFEVEYISVLWLIVMI